MELRLCPRAIIKIELGSRAEGEGTRRADLKGLETVADTLSGSIPSRPCRLDVHFLTCMIDAPACRGSAFGAV